VQLTIVTKLVAPACRRFLARAYQNHAPQAWQALDWTSCSRDVCYVWLCVTHGLIFAQVWAFWAGNTWVAISLFTREFTSDWYSNHTRSDVVRPIYAEQLFSDSQHRTGIKLKRQRHSENIEQVKRMSWANISTIEVSMSVGGWNQFCGDSLWWPELVYLWLLMQMFCCFSRNILSSNISSHYWVIHDRFLKTIELHKQYIYSTLLASDVFVDFSFYIVQY